MQAVPKSSFIFKTPLKNSKSICKQLLKEINLWRSNVHLNINKHIFRDKNMEISRLLRLFKKSDGVSWSG